MLTGILGLASCESGGGGNAARPAKSVNVPTTAPKAPDDRAKTGPGKPQEQAGNPKSLSTH